MYICRYKYITHTHTHTHTHSTPAAVAAAGAAASADVAAGMSADSAPILKRQRPGVFTI